MNCQSPEPGPCYEAHAQSWVLHGAILLSDFTASSYVMEELAPLAGMRVLDLGCGEGYVARLAAEAGAASVTGIDVSPAMVGNARASIPPETACTFDFQVHLTPPRQISTLQLT